MIQKETRVYPTALGVGFGRVFYGAQGRVYFSQVIVDDFSVAGKCYQRNDPTAEDMADVLDTDGGEILIQDAGNVLLILAYKSGVLVFCDNGVWFITGPDSGFSATAYSVSKVCPYVLYSVKSAIPVKDFVVFAGKESCYVITEEVQGSATATSLTEKTIESRWQSFITMNTKAVYDETTGLIQFVNTGDDPDVLVFNTKLAGWYPWKLNTYNELGNHSVECCLYDEARKEVLYVHKTGNTVQFSHQVKTTLNDFGNVYQSYVETQPETLGNYSKKKGTPLVQVYMQRTETSITGYEAGKYTFSSPSSCLMTLKFNWNESLRTTPREVYRALPRGFIADTIPQNLTGLGDVVQYEDKIRGSGKSLQVRFESTGQNKLELLGYTIQFSMSGR